MPCVHIGMYFGLISHKFSVLTCVSSLRDKGHSRRSISHARFPQLVSRLVRYARRWGPERTVRAVVGIAYGGTRSHEYDLVDGSGSIAGWLCGALHVELDIASTVAATSGTVGRWRRIETSWNFGKEIKIDRLHICNYLLHRLSLK